MQLIAHKCFVELLSPVGDARRAQGIVDNWTLPHFTKQGPCKSLGVAAITATIRVTGNARVLTTPPWRDGKDVSIGAGFEVDLDKYIASPWGPWHHPSSKWWIQDATAFMVHLWNCCPVEEEGEAPYGVTYYGWQGGPRQLPDKAEPSESVMDWLLPFAPRSIECTEALDPRFDF